LEEEALFIELKRLEQSERSFTREREDLLRVLEGVNSGLAGVALQSIADEEEYALMLGEGKAAANGSGSTANKKRKGGMGMGVGDIESPVSAIAPPPPPIVRKARTAKEIAQGAILSKLSRILNMNLTFAPVLRVM
jgi:DNA methyltransferase 1-associated protein 1